MPAVVTPVARVLVACLAACAFSAASAARLEITTGTGSGYIDAEIAAGADGLAGSSDIADDSADGYAAAAGSQPAVSLPLNGGSITYSWERNVTMGPGLDDASLGISGSGRSTLTLTNAGTLGSFFENSRVVVLADVLVAPTTEALGTPVSIVLAGSMSSQLATAVPGLEAIATFDITVRDHNDDVLISRIGPDGSNPDVFSLSFASTVGAHLSVEIRYDTNSNFFGASDASGDVVTSSALDASLRVTPVPEPGTWALFALGLAGVALGRRHLGTHSATRA